MTDTPPITRTLARFVVESRFSDLPPSVVHQGRRALLNWLGCAVGGSTHPAVDAALRVRERFAGPPQSTVIARGRASDLMSAALINGISSHVHDFDDGQPRNTNLNPTAAVAPAPFALGEHRGSHGRDVLHAFILGIEVECRIANAVYLTDNARWFTNSTTGVFGAAAAAGKLLGLDEQRMAWALGIAATQSSGLREMFGTMCKSFNCGRAAESGLLAALLAEEGFTSSDRSIEAPRGFAQVYLPGSDPTPIIAGLGDTYELSYVTFKPFACGIVLHAAIDACIQVRERHALLATEVARVALRLHPIVLKITGNPAPRTGLEGKFSVFHCAAVALADGAGGERQFQDGRVNDAQVLSLRARIHAESDPALRRDQAWVQVTTTDGRVFEYTVAHAVGTLDNPLSDAALETKFRALADGVLPSANVDAALDHCWRIDTLDDFATLPATVAGTGG
ncbi:MAG: MmgE/PrpD family protein [Rhodocyclaceae bacterium]|nr:MmgE/PrpD family protein [Rhodocyclaceae bacterium]MCA3074743.1 MmgE/PrpD family protein [Rhodocyclaceae bacterium]MCA3091631.1 MmgE/PrpD family protein [Rhodocyclaceae bacterium]MCA3093983.1 MmgE/PrpD family protein [Rhodocyclaceae bacterium]MCA3099226.1 MmgE/PrpD family protein [Rhodocyclaceae bacterium]